MKNKINSLLKAYKTERYNQITQHLVNPKTGITPAERLRLLNYPPFTEGVADFFGKPFHFTHGPSFIHSIDELFNDEIYKFNSEKKAPYIIDCGANIGLSIAYFKTLYPEAEILAFEPDENIFNTLKINLASIPKHSNITIEKKAVWIEDTSLEFFSEGALAGSLVTDFGKKNNIIKIHAVDFKKYLNRKIDFLKIDIEGAENTLIFDIAEKLDNVENLFLEYHGLKNEKQNLHNILKLLSEKGFRYYLDNATKDLVKHPFADQSPVSFDLQLNIFCKKN